MFQLSLLTVNWYTLTDTTRWQIHVITPLSAAPNSPSSTLPLPSIFPLALLSSIFSLSIKTLNKCQIQRMVMVARTVVASICLVVVTVCLVNEFVFVQEGDIYCSWDIFLTIYLLSTSRTKREAIYISLGKKLGRTVHLFWRIGPALYKAWRIVLGETISEEEPE